MSLCPVPRVAPAGDCEGHKGTVILGLDPRIHVNKLALLLIWIPGSMPGDDIKKTQPRGDAKWIAGSSPAMTKKKGRVFCQKADDFLLLFDHTS